MKEKMIAIILYLFKSIPSKSVRKWVIGIVRPRLKKPWITTLHNGLKIFVHPDDSIEWGMFSKSEYEKEVSACFSNILCNGATVFDIGAHVGYYTVLASRLVSSAGSVHCFEPMPHLFERLEANVSLNFHENVIMNNKALSSEEGVLSLYPANTNNSGNSSIIQRTDTDTVPLKVDATTIDAYVTKNYIEQIDLIKIDVEGAELYVLQGGIQTLQKYRPDVICEVFPELLYKAGSSVEQLRELFEGLGYQGYIITEADDLSNIYFPQQNRLQLPIWKESVVLQ